MRTTATIVTAALMMLIGAAGAQAANVLFQDLFDVPGSHPDESKWTTEIGPSSFLGRTQLADWVTPGPGGEFVVGANGAELALNTFNPSGFSLFGTHAKTRESFQPTGDSTIEFTTRMELTSLQPGIVFATYLYGCSPPTCAANHDEIDIELVTNLLQPGSLQVHLNRYADEPLGAGNPDIVNLPASFDPLAVHDWTIRWSLTQITFLVDGQPLFMTDTHIPQGPMQANIIAWGPAPDWATAYSASLQPVADALQNQRFVANVKSVTVTTTIPEPGTWAMTISVLVLIAGRFIARPARREAGQSTRASLPQQ